MLSPGRPGSWDGGCVSAGVNLIPLPDDQVGLPFTGYLCPHKYPRNRSTFVNRRFNAYALWPRERLAARLEDLQRDFSVAEAVFASAIARTQSSKTDIYASYPLVQVLEDPSLPDGPSSPKRKLAVVAGVAATVLLLFSLSLAWIRLALIRRLLFTKAERT